MQIQTASIRSARKTPVPLHFLLAGFSKCGTTTLHGLLREHPALYMPPAPRKEPWFFSHHFDTGWPSYRRIFANAPEGALLGEASTSYTTIFYEAISRQRIFEHFPDIRLIFIARDPIDRIESAFREAHDSAPKWGQTCPFRMERAFRKMPSMLLDTAFSARLENYSRYFAPEQIHVVLLEDLVANPAAVLADCFRFLGVDEDVTITRPSRRLNRGAQKLRDTLDMRRLRKRNHNPKTAELLGRIDSRVADQFLVQLGLREPFLKRSIEWSEEAEMAAASFLFEDSQRFLESQGRIPETWPRIFKMAEKFGIS